MYPTRTVGYNHMDVAYAAEVGIRLCNANYPPYGVAEFTIMLMLLALRKYKPAMWRQGVNDYSLSGLQGREIRNMTVGVMGTRKDWKGCNQGSGRLWLPDSGV